MLMCPVHLQDVPPDQCNTGIHDGLKSADPDSRMKAKTNNTLLEIGRSVLCTYPYSVLSDSLLLKVHITMSKKTAGWSNLTETGLRM